MNIKSIKAREILDSRGNPTVETEVELSSGLLAKAAVPSGASTGIFEALELRDGDKKRYNGLGVLKAVANVNKIIAPKLRGRNILDIQAIDELMIKLDGTKNKSRLGANAILSVSLACARAGAPSKKQPLYHYLASSYGFPLKRMAPPTPAFNIINGGRHANNHLDFQEFLIIPIKVTSFKEKLRLGEEVFHELGKILKEKKMATNVGDEGGYAPELKNREQALRLIVSAIKKAGYRPGKDVSLGLDVGSSELYDEQKQLYELYSPKKILPAQELIALYQSLIKKYPLISLEDPLAEEDWANWTALTKKMGKKTMLIGDDLFVTNFRRLEKGIRIKAANTILIKPNQIGTLTETMKTIKLARRCKYRIMISHRSGETMDDFIADLAVAVGAEYLKAGSLSRGERLAKYNRLAEIEDELAD